MNNFQDILWAHNHFRWCEYIKRNFCFARSLKACLAFIEKQHTSAKRNTYTSPSTYSWTRYEIFLATFHHLEYFDVSSTTSIFVFFGKSLKKKINTEISWKNYLWMYFNVFFTTFLILWFLFLVEKYLHLI